MFLPSPGCESDVGDDREAAARDVARHPREFGVNTAGHDPHLWSSEGDGQVVRLDTDLDVASRPCDIAVLLRTHAAYDLEHVAATAPLVFDTRGKMTGPNVDRL